VSSNSRTLEIPADHPSFAGHFPGQPLLPGVVVVSLILEALLDDPLLAQRLGPAPKLASAKFLAPVRPGSVLTLQWQPEGQGLRFEARLGQTVAASGRWDGCAA
jgi:3-hydroxymyristoyl/3-hydroxydecanoyl-(acyl carrier protein) dehydratase